MDSLGLNEVELCAILRDRGEDELAQEVESRTSLLPVLRALERLADSTGLRRIQLHDLSYYLTLVDADYASGRKPGMLCCSLPPWQPAALPSAE